MTDLSASLEGADIVYESVGKTGSIIGCALVSYVIDNEILGATRQIIKGIEVSNDTLSIDVIRDVYLNGPGHFLGHALTLDLMASAFECPELANRETPDAWNDAGRPALRDRAKVRVKEILANAGPLVAGDVKAKLAAHLPIVSFHD